MKPGWLRVEVSAQGPGRVRRMQEILREHRLHTVCQSAHCPNLPTCWGEGTATFMLLGEVCTRACRFCAVATGWPGGEVDPGEPARVAAAAKALGLSYVVLTSVDRDDLPDGGAGQFAATIRALHRELPGATVEALIPDFRGDRRALEELVGAGPQVVGHNLETVRRLSPKVRDPRAGYDLSLAVLRALKELSPDLITKSSLLLGLGETEGEVEQALVDLRAAGVDILVLGQYLRPTPAQLPVARYVPPQEFQRWEARARALGFRGVVAAPLARTSFRAAQVFSSLR
jgi:lipoic acid synthetase